MTTEEQIQHLIDTNPSMSKKDLFYKITDTVDWSEHNRTSAYELYNLISEMVGYVEESEDESEISVDPDLPF